ncbi:hypothetical protein [Halanaerobium praevalens]|uniref:hypothetical protein n=1 Tax=Halanaerobium praevalens TaxID=2331 RepID=UPI00031F3BE5|nr:hypothetical protein [Halanaerobium praevalens]
MTDLVNALNEKYNRDDSVQNLSNKLSRGTIKYKEVKEIADIIGAKIDWNFSLNQFALASLITTPFLLLKILLFISI